MLHVRQFLSSQQASSRQRKMFIAGKKTFATLQAALRVISVVAQRRSVAQVETTRLFWKQSISASRY